MSNCHTNKLQINLNISAVANRYFLLAKKFLKLFLRGGSLYFLSNSISCKILFIWFSVVSMFQKVSMRSLGEISLLSSFFLREYFKSSNILGVSEE